MKLSVIIPCLNAADTLAVQLDALANERWSEPWELIISDNGSTDGTRALVERYRDRIPSIRIVDASAKRGQPYAMNVAIKAAKGDAVAFCDADDEIAPGWVAAMGEALARHDFVAGRFEGRKLNPGWLNSPHAQEKGLNQFRYPTYLIHAGSGNMGVARWLHESVGGFDESMPYLFDTDYCFRLQLRGMQLHFVPEALAHIRFAQTFGTIFRKALSNGEYHVLLYKKYRALGMPKLSWAMGLLGWASLAVHLTRVRTKASLAQWLWVFGWRLGRVKGCIRYKTLAL